MGQGEGKWVPLPPYPNLHVSAFGFWTPSIFLSQQRWEVKVDQSLLRSMKFWNYFNIRFMGIITRVHI